MTIARHSYKYFMICFFIMLNIGSQWAYAGACPGNTMPEKVNAIYVKYQITDELIKHNNLKAGDPVDVVGDEIKEIIIWKGYVWERLYGKYTSIDPDDETRHHEYLLRAMQAIENRQINGEDVPMREIEKIAKQMNEYVPKNKKFEYDRIRVATPDYTVNYNRSIEKGYGYYSQQLSAENRKLMDSKLRKKTDGWQKTSYQYAHQILGLEKISSYSSSMLGYSCTREITKTSFHDSIRDYDQIETCQASISGNKINLLKKMGRPGKSYLMQAVEINASYAINKNIFCAPDYVKML